MVSNEEDGDGGWSYDKIMMHGRRCKHIRETAESSTIMALKMIASRSGHQRDDRNSLSEHDA